MTPITAALVAEAKRLAPQLDEVEPATKVSEKTRLAPLLSRDSGYPFVSGFVS